MIKIKTRIICIISISIVFLLMIAPVRVNSEYKKIGDIPINKETSIPQELNFNVSNSETRSFYFMQATANETGEFALLTRGIVENKAWSKLEYVFIDIYNEKGDFINEITFETSSEVAIKLEKNILRIYVDSYILDYELESQEIQCFLTPNGAITASGVYNVLKKSEFSVGECKYVCEKSFEGFTKLTKVTGNATEVLIQKDGLGISFFNYGTVFACSVIIVAIGLKIKRQHSNNQGKTGDG